MNYNRILILLILLIFIKIIIDYFKYIEHVNNYKKIKLKKEYPIIKFSEYIYMKYSITIIKLLIFLFLFIIIYFIIKYITRNKRLYDVNYKIISNKNLQYPVRSINFPDNKNILWITCRGNYKSNFNGAGLYKYDISGDNWKYLTHWNSNNVSVEGLTKINNSIVICSLGNMWMKSNGKPSLYIFNDLNKLKPISIDLSKITDGLLHIKCTKIKNKIIAICSSGFISKVNSIIFVDITDVINGVYKDKYKVSINNLFHTKLEVDINMPEGININFQNPNIAYIGGIITINTKFNTKKNRDKMGIIDMENIFTTGPTINYIFENEIGSQIIGANRKTQPKFDNKKYNDNLLYVSGWGIPGEFNIIDTSNPKLPIIIDTIVDKNLSFANRVKLWKNYAFMPLEKKNNNICVVNLDYLKKNKKNSYLFINTNFNKIYCLALNDKYLYVFPVNEENVIRYNIKDIIKYFK